ncbi:PKD domain-containing protein [Halorussus ruber]|uniref:PKD domain-containing protein n=1 Tax=Halorussus ruber TaxID=1126238 RepID=UPI001092BCB4|nr:PKD domain-containing protein [Halorussus ruber]
MDTDKTTILSLALTVLLVTSALPAGIVGLVGTASAQDASGAWYTVRQPEAGVCHEVRAFSHDHPKMEPEVDVRGSIPHFTEPREADVYGDFRDPDWGGFESIESIMDYRYRYYPEGPSESHAVGQTSYYAPYLNDQYRHEGWDYGTYGLYNWSDNGESHMFFYENPNGEVSLVIRHDRIYEETGTSSHNPYNGIYGPGDGFFEESPGGGAAEWQFRNLPNGEWAYIDDMYPREDMDDEYYDASGTRYGHREAEYDSEPLESFHPSEDGRFFEINWFWGSGGTDGGAYRGFENLGGRETVIEPSFSNIDAWQVRTNDGSTNGQQLGLDMSSELVIQRGQHCPDVSLGTRPSDNPPEAGETVTFTANVDESIETYYWDIDGDGEAEETTSSGTFDYTYNSAQSGTVSVTVETPDGIRDSDSISFEVAQNLPPTARVHVDPGEKGLPEYHVVGERIVLDASESTDNSGPPSDEYEWDFGDGTNGTSDSRVAHTYDETGTYEVTVEVSDPAGNTDTETITVEIVEEDTESPTARADLPDEIEAGATLTFDGGDSDDNRGIQTYRWDYNGDGSYENRTGRATHEAAPFDSQGQANVTLQVEDGGGNVDNTTVPVTVHRGLDPNVTEVSVPDEVSANEEFEVSSRVEDNGRVASVTYRFSDGETETIEADSSTDTFESSATHAFGSTGTPTVWVVARDAAGNEVSSDQYTVNVTDAPNAVLSASTNETEAGEPVTLDASGSSDASGQVVEYQWDFDGDGRPEETTNSSRPSVNATYDDGDTYDATVTVVDDTGRIDTASVEIEVEDDEDERAAIGGGGGGGASLGPPPVSTDVEKSGSNAAKIDVRNAQSDQTITAGLPASATSNQTGVQFERVAIDVRRDDPHVVFQTAASAESPSGVTQLTEADEAMAYLQMDAKYLDRGVRNATVEFTVQKSALGALGSADDVSVHQYDDGWTELNATVVKTTGDAVQLKATAHSLGTLAVGASNSLSVAEAGLATDTVATGDDVTANATVENAGSAARSATVNLTVGDTVAASKTVEVAAGQTANVTLTGTATTTGSYEVSVGGVSAGNLTVKETLPAETAVSDVSLNESTIAAGETVEITAAVENTGGSAGEQNVTLTMFGKELATETVEVPAGETKEVTFVRKVDAAGNYTVEVSGQTADLGVTESDDGGFGDRAPDVPGFGVGAALVALLAAALLARMRD